MKCIINILLTFVIVIVSIIIVAQPVRSEVAPYSNAITLHEVDILNETGLFKDGYSHSYINKDTGEIYHNAVATTANLGGIDIFVSDKMETPFTVTTSGDYSIIFDVDISGKYWDIMNSILFGFATGGTEFDFVIKVIGQEGTTLEYVPLLDTIGTDNWIKIYINAAFETIWNAKDTLNLENQLEDMAGDLEEIASLLLGMLLASNSDYILENLPSIPIEGSFTIVIDRYLDAGQEYKWSVQTVSETKSVSSGPIFHFGILSSNIKINEVRIEKKPTTSSPPSIAIAEPDITIKVDEGVAINWMDIDEDSDAAISLWEDNNNSDYNGSLLISGLSEDNLGIYGHYYLSTNGMPDGKEFYVYAKIADELTINNSENYSAKIIVDHPTQDYNAFSTNIEWSEDAESDGDGVTEAGENVDIDIDFINNTGEDITDVEARLAVLTDNIDVLNGYEALGSMSSGQTGLGEFEICLNPTTEIQVNFELQITFKKNGSPYYQNYSFSKIFPEEGTVAPIFDVCDVIIKDGSDEAQWNNTDGILQSGEHIKFDLYLKNIGNADAVDVEAELNNVRGLGRDFELDGILDNYPDLPQNSSCEKQTSSYFSNIKIPTDFEGIITADLTFRYGDSKISRFLEDVPLFNVQPEAWLEVYPGDYNFGTTGPDLDVTKTVEIRNKGTIQMTVTEITALNGDDTSSTDTSWTGDPLPWTLQPGESKTIEVTIETADLNGQTISRKVVVTSTGRSRIYDEVAEDRIIISGLVSDSAPINKIPNTNSVDMFDVGEDWIVYLGNRNGNWDIFAFQISTGDEKQITNNNYIENYPKISGDLIAWEDYRNDDGTNSNIDIYGYDLATEQEFVISNLQGMQRLIGVDDNLLAFISPYYVFTEPSNWPSANDIFVYEYQGNGQLIEKYGSHFTLTSNHEPKQNISRHGDFGESLLVFERFESYWYTHPSSGNQVWSVRNKQIAVIDFSKGETSPHSVMDLYALSQNYAAGSHKFVVTSTYTDASNNTTVQLLLWDDGDTKSLTEPGTENVSYGQQALAMSSDFIVYNKDEYPNKLFYMDLREDLSTYPEYLVTDQLSSGPFDVKMDDSTVVWAGVDPSDSQWYIFYSFLTEHISVSTDTIDFSEIIKYEISDITLTITNIGVDDLQIGNIAETDNLEAPFAIIEDNCSGLTIPPRGSCILVIRFSPTNIGSFQDTFDIPSSDELNSLIYITVQGQSIENPDHDNDSIQNEDDNCPYYYNPEQSDIDEDGLGDYCDPDTDGDGMPDGWEVEYDLDPLVDDAIDDLDEDGYTNLEEYLKGTDPTDADSHPSKAMPWLPLLLE